jgi:Rap1 Myb domain
MEGYSINPQNDTPSTANARPIGSTLQPAKTTKTPYSVEDEVILWNWVQDAQRKGRAILGNEIYKELELVVSIH